MTSQGHPHAIFQRALERRQTANAWTMAAELGRVSVPDSLALVLLLAHDDRVNRYQRAAARWVARYTVERKVEIHETALIASQLVALDTPARDAALRTLADHFDARAQPELSRVVRAWL